MVSILETLPDEQTSNTAMMTFKSVNLLTLYENGFKLDALSGILVSFCRTSLAFGPRTFRPV